MFLKSLRLTNFRNYAKSEFEFNSDTILIVGPNTSGKTNFAEGIFFLSVGRSFRAEKDGESVSFGKEVAHITGTVVFSKEGKIEDGTKLEVAIQKGDEDGTARKKYKVNGVAKRRLDFAGNLVSVLFLPEHLDIIIDSPSLRRNFLDNVLEQVDRDYRAATISFTKGLRQRNALLDHARESGIRNEKQFEYWDNLLIESGSIITQKREEFITFINDSRKDIFDFAVFYDKSVISKARLLQYKEAEASSGVTLVGPHRDDVSFHMYNNTRRTTHDIKQFGSRGQQRLTILQLKLIELTFIESTIGQRPILVLDDIFSELDQDHIKLVLEEIHGQQTILTATHKEFFDSQFLKKAGVIELKLK
ncbi:MAG: DNA replication and repair protein RecF [Candidatus Levybacteria bacterium]|nr:DNA replication and repair protein RecF [Candidatus Levybacteria bacterium]